MRASTLALGLLFSSALAAPAIAGDTVKTLDEPSTLKAHEASYSARYNGIPIRSVRTFVRDGDDYVLTNKAQNFLGSISEEERFTIGDDGKLLPISYRFERSILGTKRSEKTDFHRDRNIAVNTYKGETVELPLQDEPYAPLSYQEQMRRDLQAGKENLHYEVVYRNKIRDYQYEIVRNEKLDTPIGELDTTVLKRVREDDERETYLWTADALGYLPVKLVQTEDGETYEMMIESYSD